MKEKWKVLKKDAKDVILVGRMDKMCLGINKEMHADINTCLQST